MKINDLLLYISEWIMRFSILNLIWIVFNLPIVILIFNSFQVVIWTELSFYLILICVLAPFFLFPSTTAAFAVVRKWIIKDDRITIFRSYWLYYRENYQRSLVGGLLISFIWLIWILAFYTWGNSPVFHFLSIINGAFLYVIMIHFFSTTVHYQLHFRATIMNSIYLTIGSPILSISILISSFGIIYISVVYLTFLIPFFTLSFIAFVSFLGYYRLTEKIEYAKSIKSQNE